MIALKDEKSLIITEKSEVVMFQNSLPARLRNGVMGILYISLFTSPGWAYFPGDLELREDSRYDKVRQKWYEADEYQERRIREEMLDASAEALFQCQFSNPTQSREYFFGIMSQWVNSHLELIDVIADERKLKSYQNILRGVFAKAVEKVMPDISSSPLVPVTEATNDNDAVSETVFSIRSRSPSPELFFD